MLSTNVLASPRSVCKVAIVFVFVNYYIIIKLVKGRVDRNAFEPRHEKTNVLVSDTVQHKPGCTATEDGQRRESSDLERGGIVLSVQRKQRR